MTTDAVALRAPPPAHPLRMGVRAGVAAARANLVPGLILQAALVALVVSYYFSPTVASAFAAVARQKEAGGLAFSAVSTATFGALIPFLLARWVGVPNAAGVVQRRPWVDLLFLVPFWGLRGMEIDLLYRGQAWLFGASPGVTTVLAKVIVDQFVYAPLYALPLMVVLYTWHEGGYRVAETRRRLGPRPYTRRVVPVMVGNWGVWVPATALIYALPVSLQLPVQNLVLSTWVLIFTFLVRR